MPGSIRIEFDCANAAFDWPNTRTAIAHAVASVASGIGRGELLTEINTKERGEHSIRDVNGNHIGFAWYSPRTRQRRRAG